MAITFTDQSIFKSKMQSVVIPVNLVGVMGAGLALKAKRSYHIDMAVAYTRWCNAAQIGDMGYWPNNGLSKFPHNVVWFPTKIHWKNLSRIEYITLGCATLAEKIEPLEITGLAMPMIGCGLGGLEWDDVLQELYNYLGPLSIPVEVSLYGQQHAKA